MTRPRSLAFGLAASMFVSNLVLERWMWGFGEDGKNLIPGLVDFSPAFNRGVSFGLLAQDGVTGRYLLIALLVTIMVGVAVIAWRVAAPLAALGFGLILGGALGNLCDRVFLRGAVFDFLWVHVGNLSLFVCNFADIAISAGVVALLLDSLWKKPGAGDFSERPAP